MMFRAPRAAEIFGNMQLPRSDATVIPGCVHARARPCDTDIYTGGRIDVAAKLLGRSMEILKEKLELT